MKEGEEFTAVSDGAGGISLKRKFSSSDSGGDGCLSSLILIGLFVGGIVYFLDYVGWIELDSNDHIVNTKGLNLRKVAGTEGEIIKLLKQNDSIWQINDSSTVIGGNTWIFVTDKTDTGWVNQQFIK